MGKRLAEVLVLAMLVGGGLACSDDDEGSGPEGVAQGGPGVAVDGLSGGETSDAGLDLADGATEDDSPLFAHVAQGDLKGEDLGGSVRFLKIPFAKPPEGALRWAAPEAPDPWDGVRYETEFAPPCPQGMSNQSVASTEEDCLYLNVWRPNRKVTGAPVMVWIHGGGFSSGSPGDYVPVQKVELWHDGRVFAERHGIVLVSISYRLGALGFMSHPVLADHGLPAGNQGLLDQQQALRWIHDNIAAFGGDPENVTLFGQSAGAGAVCIHMVSPGSQGLFHRAISQSGGCSGGPPGLSGAELEEALWAWSDELGCPRDGEEDVLTCLRGQPVEAIVPQVTTSRLSGMTQARPIFRVTIDGTVLPDDPKAMLDAGKAANVPYIIGSTNDEGRLYVVSIDVPDSDEAYLEYLRASYGEFAERISEMYPPVDPSGFNDPYRTAIARIRTDQMVCGIYESALSAARAGLEVYSYNFNIPWSILPSVLGACHASEISHVFGTPYNDTPESEAVAVQMNAYWAQFAQTGNPNGEGTEVEWPRFEPDVDEHNLRIQFDPDMKIIEDFRLDECRMWREYNADN